MSILDGIPAIVSGALDGLMKDATLSKYAKASDGRGGRTAGAATNHAVRSLILDFSDFERGMSEGSIKIADRKAIVMTQGMTVAPAIGDGFALEGEWSIIAVKRDPAAATYELQLRPGAPV